MAAPTVYRSTDTSAPILTGQVGSLVALLDACLVNGYGSKSAAGWSKAFSGTNAASYKQGTASGADCYLDVDDNGSGAAGAQEATVRGYEAMTAVATGTNPFPTTAQIATPGLFIRKSATADATARDWLVIADDKTFHLFASTGDTAGRYATFSFGEFYSFQSADAYRTAIIGHNLTGNGARGLDQLSTSSSSSAPFAGLYVPRVAAGSGTSINPALLCVGSGLYSAQMTGPNALDGNMYVSRLFVTDSTTTLRGYLRGFWQLVTGGSGVNDGDTFSGTGDFAGRTFLIVKALKSTSTAAIALETTAWDTSS